ncbi:hypothetical protein Glo7428_4892 (plasmid) [Gloeocapsa sp. PCC 7428]|uniref:hypothetical protein n=1 Tax=Gloeocapsa sp. PCC 7428 TaxID=1173026 RepID=UPI0002A6123D|nr:hypothetical protein [Gloeocapsa sp. PCC 7428]AFZ33315.1 hypothetical protein Glo7428_4892 [Gloeocapsa sp. PCC 7428]
MQPSTGLRQRELCKKLGLDYRLLATQAKEQGISTHAYIQQLTGWILRNELYYPPEKKERR